VGAANSWPLLAMSFSTTEPLATQWGFAAAAALAGALVSALLLRLAAGGGGAAAAALAGALVSAWLLGLAAGVGVYAAAHARRWTLPSAIPVWGAGVAAAF